jgi:hypothetical protein
MNTTLTWICISQHQLFLHYIAITGINKHNNNNKINEYLIGFNSQTDRSLVCERGTILKINVCSHWEPRYISVQLCLHLDWKRNSSNFTCFSLVLAFMAFVVRYQTVWKIRLEDSKFRFGRFVDYWHSNQTWVTSSGLPFRSHRNFS